MNVSQLPHHHEEPEQIDYIAETLGETDRFQRAADMLRQMDDTTRVRIFWLLCHCEECVINISALMGMSSPAVSHHLRSLRSAGLITGRREGREVYYRAAKTPAALLLHETIEAVMEVTCPK